MRNKRSSSRPWAVLVTALLIILVLAQLLFVLARHDGHFRMLAKTALQYIGNWRRTREAQTTPGRPPSPATNPQVTCTFTPDRGVGWGLMWTINSEGNATPPLVSATWTGTVRCPWQIADGAVTVSQTSVWSNMTETLGYNSAAGLSIDVLRGTFSGTLPLSPIGPQKDDTTTWNGSWRMDNPPTQNSDGTWTEHGTWTSSGKPNCCQ
jgi:hypothetical protein